MRYIFSKRYVMSVLAGSMLAGLMLESAAIAQVTYYVPPSRELFQEWSKPITFTTGNIYFGRTNKGNRLELAPDSVVPGLGGITFTYYLNGRPVQGFTRCDESAWYVNGERIPATSRAATGMLDDICGYRVSRTR